MSKGYNRQSFDLSDENWRAKYDAFMTVLLDDYGDTYNDIHTYREDFFIIIEWSQIPYDHEYGGKFEFVDTNECVVLIKTLPDETRVQVDNEEEWREIQDTWLKENPGWNRDFYGNWSYSPLAEE